MDIGWQVALDPGFDDVVAKGTATTGPDDDFTVKVDVGDLDPATTYWYRFEAPGADGALSPVGRARTAPALAEPVADMRLGLVSCASLPAGRFHAYRNLAARDVDLVVHVGDYIYENDRHARTEVRPHQPRPAAVSLSHYRARHAQYKADPHLRALHARHPMVAVWDDHEFAGGSWRDGAAYHDDRYDGPWAARRAAAVRAYREWMPVRWPGEGDRVYRSFHWGDLVDLAMLDTRLIGRDRPLHGADRVVFAVRDRGRSLLGGPQREWLAAELAASTARWRVIGSQVVVAPIGLVAGRLVNPGQWDGYPDERDWLYDQAGRGGRERRGAERRHPLVVGVRPPRGGRVRDAERVVPQLRQHPRAGWGARGEGGGGGVPVAEPPPEVRGPPPPRVRGGRRHPGAGAGRLVAPRQRRPRLARRALGRQLAPRLGRNWAGTGVGAPRACAADRVECARRSPYATFLHSQLDVQAPASRSPRRVRPSTRASSPKA